MNYIFSAIVGYFFGALPFSYLVPKYIKGIDIRKIGSGNVGSTNVYRTCGVKIAALAFFLDLVKGFVPIMISTIFWGRSAALLSGFFCILGHCYSFMLNFKGGKGIATTGGVLLFLNPVLFVTMTTLEFVLIFSTKMVSVASLIVATLFPIASIFYNESKAFVAFSCVLSIFIIYQHRSNITRIMKGEEKKLDFKKKN